MCWTIDAKDPTVPTVGIKTGSTVGIVGALLRSMGLGQSPTGLVVTICDQNGRSRSQNPTCNRTQQGSSENEATRPHACQRRWLMLTYEEDSDDDRKVLLDFVKGSQLCAIEGRGLPVVRA